MTVTNITDSIIIHADIPTLHLRKALRAGLDETLENSVISFVSEKLPNIEITDYCPHRKLETGIFLPLEFKSSIRELGLKDHESVFFLKRNKSSSSSNEKTVHPALSKYKRIVPAGESAANLLKNSIDQSCDDEVVEIQSGCVGADAGGEGGTGGEPCSSSSASASASVASASSGKKKRYGLASIMTRGKKAFGSSNSSLKKVFGSSMVNGEIPSFLVAAITCLRQNFLDVEGLFRLSGAAHSVNQLKEKIDNNREVKFTSDMDPHVISGLIKLYLREMPEPLLTFQLFEVFRSVCLGNLSQDKVVQYLKAGLCLLPEANRNLLRWLFGFLVDLAKFQEHNRMTFANIATVIGPNIMKQKDESAFDLVTNAPIVNGVCISLLKYYDQVLRSDDYEDVPFRAIGRIIYPYEGSADNDQITLVQDEIVYIRDINRDGDGWWIGETRGHQGMFPGSYVKYHMESDHHQVLQEKEIPSQGNDVVDVVGGGLATTSEDESECQCEQLFQTLKTELDLERNQRKHMESLVLNLQDQVKGLEAMLMKMQTSLPMSSSSQDDSSTTTVSHKQETIMAPFMPTTYKPSRSKSLTNRTCNNNNKKSKESSLDESIKGILSLKP